jgi:hypothetical protein
MYALGENLEEFLPTSFRYFISKIIGGNNISINTLGIMKGTLIFNILSLKFYDVQET